MISEVKMLSQADWEIMYPKKDYKAKAGQLLFHFLLALDQPDATIVKFMESKQTLLTAVDKENDGLTPLIIATMKGRVVIVKAMLDNWKDFKQRKPLLEMRDAHEWSALDHARISSKEIFDLLQAAGASSRPVISDRHLSLLRSKQIDSYTLKCVSIESADKRIIALKEHGIAKIGLESYRDIPYFSDSTLSVLWRRTRIDKPDFASTLFKRFQSAPPRLLIGICPSLIDTSNPFELRAGELIPEATCLGVYSGAGAAKTTKKYASVIGSFKEKAQVEAYLMEQLDARTFGNISRMANWGWPNVTVDSVASEGQKLPILVSIENIPTGKPILFNYRTMAALALDVPAPILGVEEMRSFYDAGFDNIVDEFLKIDAEVYTPHFMGERSMSSKEYCRYNKLLESLIFPLNFPAALLDLHYRDIVPVENWIRLISPQSMARSLSLSLWYKDIQYSYLLLRAICYHVLDLDKLIRETAIKSTLSDWLKNRIGKFSVLQLVRVITMFGHGIKNNRISAQNWDQISAQFDEYLRTYIAANDTQCPLGPKEIWMHKAAMMDQNPAKSAQDHINALNAALNSLKEEGLPEDHDVVIENKMLLAYYQNKLQ